MIDTRIFEPAESRWGDIFKQLKKSGISVYAPGVKTGDCIEPYVVVAISSSSEHPSFSTNIDLYSVMCYVPKQSYSELEPLLMKVEKALKELEPMVMPYGQRQPSYYDDSIKAHMVSIIYKNYKKK